jgi:hypothetical protein
MSTEQWTVIGFWLEDEPVPVGVVWGNVPVSGGYSVNDGELIDGARGPWAVGVAAADDSEAEKLAVQEMLRVQFGDDEEKEDA